MENHLQKTVGRKIFPVMALMPTTAQKFWYYELRRNQLVQLQMENVSLILILQYVHIILHTQRYGFHDTQTIF